MFSSALKSFSSNINNNYVLSTEPKFKAGPWRVFDAKKKSTGKNFAIFVFERKALEPPGGGLQSRSDANSRRKLHDEVLERLKKEASSLARLRHPSLLELAEPVEETRSGGLMFATEPIITTLATLFESDDSGNGNGGSKTHDTRGNSNTGAQDDSLATLDELEIQKGMLQIAKGLGFMHESARLVHGNLTPDAIYVNAKGDWKIGGLGFSGPSDSSSNSTTSASAPIALSELLYHDPRLPRTVQLNLDYTSPDFVMDNTIGSSADMFSLGLIIIALYSKPHKSPLSTHGNVSTYKKIFSSSSSIPTQNNNFLCSKPIPAQLASDVLARLITRRPATRMNAQEFQESRFFDNVLVSTIRFLDSLPAKTPNEKSQFMRGLPRIIDQFPASVLDKKLLPALLEETKDRELLALILANVFKIMNLLLNKERTFEDKVLGKLREIFLLPAPKGNSAERDTSKDAGLAIVLEHLPEIAKMCPGKSFKDDILPLVVLGLESTTSAIIDKALGCIPTMLTVLDFSTIKHDLFPVVAAVFSKTTSLAIKIKGLQALQVLCGGYPGASTSQSKSLLDKYSVQEKVVPLLKGIKTKEPAVIMAALEVFKAIGSICDFEFLVTDVLPILWNFSLGPLLNLDQFQEYMDQIKSMSSRIEREQTRKLQELATSSTNMNSAASRNTDLMNTNSMDDPFDNPGGQSDFERLVLGKVVKSSNNAWEETNTPVTQQRQPQQGSTSMLAWQSAPQAMATVLQPTQTVSRAITPDQSLNLFPTLAPSSSTRSALPSMSVMQPLQPSGSWSNPQTPGLMANSVWPGNSNTAAAPNLPQGGATPSINWNAALKPASTFSIAHPPSAGIPKAATNGFSLPAPPVTSPKKSGLDAYESLI